MAESKTATVAQTNSQVAPPTQNSSQTPKVEAKKVFEKLPNENSSQTPPQPKPSQATQAQIPTPTKPSQPSSTSQPKQEEKMDASKMATLAGMTAAEIEKSSSAPSADAHEAGLTADMEIDKAKEEKAKKETSLKGVSASNPGAKELPSFASTSAQATPIDPKNPNPNKQEDGDKTTLEQFLNHKQDATGKMVKGFFKQVDKQNSKDNNPPPKNEEEKQIREAEKIYQEGLASIRDLIAPSSFETHYNHINLSGILVRSFFVYTYPRYLETNWLSPVINFDAAMDISQFIYPIASNEIMSMLKKKVAQLQSSIKIDMEKGNVRDPAVETALEDAESLRTELQRGQEKFFQFGLYFSVYAEDEKKLESVTKQIESMLGGKLVLTKRADIQAEHAFNSTLPMCTDEVEVFRNMNTTPLASTFPFVSADLASNEGILYGLNRHNNSLIIFDRFKLPNANSVVFASSGAGKSFAVKLEILRLAMMGTDVIIIDPENEYQALTETLGGTYLKMSLNSTQCINPFDLPKAFEGDDTKPGDLLRENIITLTGLMKLMLGEMSATEESLLDKALIDTYAVHGITMDQENPGEIPPPTMEDFYSVLSSMKGAENLAERLQKYTTGTFGGIFNKATNVDLDSGVVVFCIRDLEEMLRPIAMYILLNFIWNRVRSSLKRRALVIDEAWTMMQHEDAAKFLHGLVKRARKYYLGVTTITQDVQDFLGSKYGRPVVTNSSMQLLLKQAPSSMEVLQKTFNLTDGEKYMLLNSGVGQGLFFADNKHVAVQIIASYSENQIVTTNPEEMLKMREEREAQFEKKK